MLFRSAEIAEMILHSAKQVSAERATASQLVFIDTALAFVHAHRHAAPQWGQQVSVINALFVTSMADLVDGGIEAVERIIG